MALEDLTGSKTIDSLVRTNPDGADFQEFGDDHLRGFKNVLLNTFPNVTGAVTATQNDLNGVFTTNTKMAFHQASAPTNWTQDTSAAATNTMLRIVNGTGGGTGGSLDPVTHVHATGNHALTIAEIPSHDHDYVDSNVDGGGTGIQGGSGAQELPHTLTTDPTGGGGIHNHGNTVAADIKYVDVILCSKN